MNDVCLYNLLAALLVEKRIENDLKACELDAVQNRFGSDSLVGSITADRKETYEKWPAVRQFFGVKR